MSFLDNLIERCQQRHEKPLRQRKTMVMPALYNKGHLYQLTVYCAQRYPVLLAELERADISFMPIGHASENDRGPRDLGGARFLKCQGIRDWGMRRWRASWGIQIYTGTASEHNGGRWHDIDFKYEAISAAPDAVFACIETLLSTVESPLLTISKSGGLRFSCRVLDYLYPNTKDSKLYIYKRTPIPENPHQRDVYLEVLGENSYSRWDARYEILLGNLLDPPLIPKEVLFAPIDALRAELHEPIPLEEQKLEDAPQVVSIAPSSLGSHNLDLAKEALLKRGFSYVRQENGFHHWTQPVGTVSTEHVLLWERDGTVWVRASTPDIGLPTETTAITDVWTDTGIVSLTVAVGLSVPDEMLAVREGQLSPLAIRRPPPVLRKPEYTKKRYEILEKNTVQTHSVFDETARILGFITNTDAGNHEAASYLLNGGAICLNVPVVRLAEETEQHYQNRNLPSFARWKPRMHRWEQVKDIPIDVRMATAFQRGNVCEDPERCTTLEEKGGNPSESICPQCPVYTKCQQHGYLSQLATLQRTKAQILAIPQLFFNPQYAELVEEISNRWMKQKGFASSAGRERINYFPNVNYQENY